MSKKRVVMNSAYKKLQPRFYTSLRMGVRSPDCSKLQNTVGVVVVQSGKNGSTSVGVVIPTGRTEKGSRTTFELELSGRQARQVYETLRKFYETKK